MKITSQLMKTCIPCCLLIAFLHTAPWATAQDTVPQVERAVLRANLLLSPKIEGEFALSQNATLGARVGSELFTFEQWIVDYFFVLLPSVDVYYRYYYNLDRRLGKGKRIYRNSGNYVSMTALYANGNPIWSERPEVDIDGKHFLVAGPVYGLQRTYGKGFFFNLEFGVGYGYADDASGSRLLPIANLRLGWAFGL